MKQFTIVSTTIIEAESLKEAEKKVYETEGDQIGADLIKNAEITEDEEEILRGGTFTNR